MNLFWSSGYGYNYQVTSAFETKDIPANFQPGCANSFASCTCTTIDTTYVCMNITANVMASDTPTIAVTVTSCNALAALAVFEANTSYVRPIRLSTTTKFEITTFLLLHN